MATSDMAGILASMTPEQLAQTPAAMPPAGVMPNLIDPPSGAPVLITVSTVLFAIMLVFAALRFYVKLAIRHKMASDDCKLVDMYHAHKVSFTDYSFSARDNSSSCGKFHSCMTKTCQTACSPN